MEKLRKKTQKRFWEIDFIRGICVLLMVFDHFLFSAGNVFPSFLEQFDVSFWQGLIDFSDYYWFHNARRIVQFIVVAVFLLLCGISCTLTKSNLKRGIKTCLCAAAITAVTYLFSVFSGMEATIWFGVVHMLGASMLIYFVCQIPYIVSKRKLEKLSFNQKSLSSALSLLLRLLPAIIGLITLIVYFAGGYGEFVKRLNDSGAEYTDLVSNITVDGGDGLKKFLSMFFYIKGYVFVSADYYPILPYAALVLIGGAIGELYYRRRLNKPIRFNPKAVKPVSFVGRHALIVYLGHQIIVAAFFGLAAWFASL